MFCDRGLGPRGHSDPAPISAFDSSVPLSSVRERKIEIEAERMWNSTTICFCQPTQIFSLHCYVAISTDTRYEQNLTRPIGQPADEALRIHTHTHAHKGKIYRCARCQRWSEITNNPLRLTAKMTCVCVCVRHHLNVSWLCVLHLCHNRYLWHDLRQLNQKETITESHKENMVTCWNVL